MAYELQDVRVSSLDSIIFLISSNRIAIGQSFDSIRCRTKLQGKETHKACVRFSRLKLRFNPDNESILDRLTTHQMISIPSRKSLTARVALSGMIGHHLRSFCLSIVVAALAWPAADGANGVIYYNRIATLNTPATVRRIGGDGNGDQALAVNLPSPIYPTISRSGRFLLMTSTEPGRPFKISNNVFLTDLATGAQFRITSYQDEYVLGGVRFMDDIGQLFGNNTISSYKVHYPYHKALSPDETRVVVMNLFRSGSIVLGTPLDPNEVQASSGRLPLVDVFNVADALPAGPYVYLAPQARDGFNQGGDGLDWHPGVNEVVATVASDIPTVGNAGISSMAGTLLAVFSTTSTSPFIRKLTNPIGEIDIINGNLFYFGVHDYAPAISPDGRRVAFARHSLRQGIETGYAPFPCQCSIRIINYDGTEDQGILSLPDGAWITKVTWSPAGNQIAFDVSPQLTLNGRFALLGDVTQSTIHVVNTDGTNSRQLVAGPASYPSWGSELRGRPTLQISRNGTAFQIRVDGLIALDQFRVQGSTDLQNWETLLNTQATSSSQLIDITPNPQSSFAFYRVAIP
jgi:hypothetical protein